MNTNVIKKKNKFKKLNRFLTDTKNKKCLDIGCGTGETGAYFDFWEYYPSTDTWIEKRQFPYDIWPENIFALTLNNNGYILMGKKTCGNMII